MFGLFEEKHPCPSCGHKTMPSKTIRISRHRTLKVFNCSSCNADFIKNKRSELFPVLEEGTILC